MKDDNQHCLYLQKAVERRRTRMKSVVSVAVADVWRSNPKPLPIAFVLCSIIATFIAETNNLYNGG